MATRKPLAFRTQKGQYRKREVPEHGATENELLRRMSVHFVRGTLRNTALRKFTGSFAAPFCCAVLAFAFCCSNVKRALRNTNIRKTELYDEFPYFA